MSVSTTSLSINTKIVLDNDVAIEQLGFGTYKLTDFDELDCAVNAALKTGYRAFDTAELYQNEKQLGKVISQCGVKRSDLFITSKIANEKQGYDNTLKGFEQTLKDLELDYIDLFLVHWPLKDTFFDTWEALERIYEQKLARAIGVCNFQISHLEMLETRANIKPMINQIELHPYLTQKELVNYLRDNDIAVEAWSPIARNMIKDEAIFIELGKKYGKSAAQLALRWHLQHGHIAIPKSSHPERIAANADIYDFALTDSEMQQIDGLNKNFRVGPNPDEVYQKNGF
ncbi:aldo/keto reductase [Orbaceae bacterium ESL0721]|nr:aldo/keto reductase [Orbaceae bacterium ESL0721]